MFKSGDHFASQISHLVENRKSTGKIPATVLIKLKLRMIITIEESSLKL
jgi:hypothetical protein